MKNTKNVLVKLGITLGVFALVFSFVSPASAALTLGALTITSDGALTLTGSAAGVITLGDMTWTPAVHPTRDVLQVGSITNNGKIAVAGDNVNVFSIEGKSSAASASAGAKISNFGWLTVNDTYDDADPMGTKVNRFNIGSNYDADLLLSSPHQIRIVAADNTVTGGDPLTAVDNGVGNIALISRSDIKFAPWAGAEDINAQYLRLSAMTETVFTAGTGTYNGGELTLGALTGALHLNEGSTTGGVVFPSMTALQRDALTAVEGELIFNDDTNKMNFWNGTAWEAITSS